LTDRKT